ncbi:potassium channel-like protein [Phyllosticta citriasiana]|uniref:Potassium channel-like protein n=1 Tax=Phyllosticta citriasiana TaxID=595635 RepID=A0ABR1KXE5_9PEZI
MSSDNAAMSVAEAEKSSDSRTTASVPTTRDGPPGISIAESARRPSLRRARTWKAKLKKKDDREEYDWWFASTAIPLLAATLGPLANVLSIAALVTYWRMDLIVDGKRVSQSQGQEFEDPRWCFWINAASLICGFVGNIFLLMNFTQRIRYIIALPVTIILWYFATSFLTGILASMEIYVPPNRPDQTYTEGYWYGVMAAIMYCICSMLLMVNMVGYWRGHYPQKLILTESQRMLIVQTMLFFVWLAGGGAVFARLESLYGEQKWSFVQGLYFCDVTILTVGFGDLYPTCDAARGLVFPFSVGGIIMLGLVISSIYRFGSEMGKDEVIKKHMNKIRIRTVDRSVSSSFELRRRQAERKSSQRPQISAPFDPVDRSAATRIPTQKSQRSLNTMVNLNVIKSLPSIPVPQAVRPRKPKILLLREEKDRFDTMRKIQKRTANFRRWTALTLSILAFGILWLMGAVVFWQAEQETQGMTYFQALYFCYVSLLTIGYGDLAPKSNAGRPFFVVWSLVAVPTMTTLISDMSDTVISGFKHSSDRLAEFTVLPKYGIWREFLERHPWLLAWLQERAAHRRVKRGVMPVGPGESMGDDNNGDDVNDGGAGDRESDAGSATFAATSSDASSSPRGRGRHRAGTTSSTTPNLADLASSSPATQSNASLSRRLAHAIRRVANDLKSERETKYAYEDWVEFTRLIRFGATAASENAAQRAAEEDAADSLVDWDWIGEDSPMVSGKMEAEFVLDKLCASLERFLRALAEREGGEFGAEAEGRPGVESAGGGSGSKKEEAVAGDGIVVGDG